MRTHTLLNFLLATSCSLTANATVYINEVMPKNSSAVINENFNFEGWVELYNSGDESVDLSQCYFANSDDDHFQWKNLANTVIEPKGYAVFYFDELNKGNHASFKLDADGGVIILSDVNGNEIDRMKYPEGLRNTSYGRTTDGGENFGFFLTSSQGTSNVSAVATKQTAAPVFSETGGFYNSGISVAISAANPLATIYYTTDGSEPKASTSNQYTEAVTIDATTVLRAVAVVDGEVSSDITTASFFVANTIPASLKVVSLSTDNEFFYGDTLGAFAIGTNGSTVPTYCSAKERKANYMNDWDRPCNIELFDEGKVERINQEVKIGAFGACSRTKAVKSIKVKANKIYGSNKLDYPIFNEKPNLKWKSFVLRNSGNDFGRMLFRDGFLQTLASQGMDIDHQAYEPAVVFVNGKYYGMLGIRERTNKDFVYSNYGLSDDEFCIEESSAEANQCDSYQEVLDAADNASSLSYSDINKIIDVDEMLNYFVTEIYYCNEDWSGGNIKAWKRNEDGKWRWIMYDTDFSTSLYGNYLLTDGFTYAEKCSFFPLLLENEEIKRRLVNKFVVQTGTTFAEDHVSAVMDSLIGLLHDEADYYFNYIVSLKKNEVNSWRDECEKVRNFITARPEYLFDDIASNLELNDFAPIRICSDVEHASYQLNGLDIINKKDFRSYYFEDLDLDVKAIAPDGYKFKEWQICKEKYLIPSGATWKYVSTAAGAGWNLADFDDSAWSAGATPVAYGISYLQKTAIKTSSSRKTAYFRNTFTIDDLDSAGDLFCTLKVNDGAVIYVNGKEAYRFNMTTDQTIDDTLNAELTMDSYATRQFSISKDFLVQGVNTIAVEVHKAYKSTTIGFDLSVQDSNNQLEVLGTSLNQDYTAVFADSLTLKAVFEDDPTWSADSVRLYLNEICVANKQYVDEYREDDDWIEIYNDGSSPVDLGGMYISDKDTNLTRYQIPTGYAEETTIPAKGYLIIWADADSSEQGILHTNFQLDKKKCETVILSRELNGQIEVVDSVRYQLHTKGNSYARFSYEGDGAWALTSVPTFYARNVFAPEHSKSLVEEVLAENNGFDVRVYPNPVNDYLWFAFGNEERAVVSVISYTGQIISQEQVENGGSIYVGNLNPSIYIVSVKANNRVVTTRFIKK